MRALAALALSMCACGSPDPMPQNIPPKYADVAEIHHDRCGGCHKRVEPGQRTHAKLETALVRHRSRVKMSEEQWSLLIDYLAQTP